MSLKKRAAFALATWGGSGYSPIAPGTVGSLATLPLHFALKRANPLAYAGVTLAITYAGIWASQVVADELGKNDPSEVVVDEVAGTLIAMGLVRKQSLAVQLSALALFRVLDITKPGPIRKAEKAKPEGLGIMMDDVLAGALAGAISRIF